MSQESYDPTPYDQTQLYEATPYDPAPSDPTQILSGDLPLDEPMSAAAYSAMPGYTPTLEYPIPVPTPVTPEPDPDPATDSGFGDVPSYGAPVDYAAETPGPDFGSPDYALPEYGGANVSPAPEYSAPAYSADPLAASYQPVPAPQPYSAPIPHIYPSKPYQPPPMAQTYQPAPVVPVYQPAPVVQAYAPAPVVQPYIPPPAYQPQASYSVYNPAAVQPVVYGTPMMGAPIVVPPSNSAATASLVTGIIGIFFAFIPFIGIIIALPCAITALITAIIGMSKGSLNRIGRGPATAGLVLSIITFIMMVFGGGWLW